MEGDNFTYLAPAEVEAAKALRPEIGHHLLAAMSVLDLIEKCFGSFGHRNVKESSIWQRVALSLLVKLGNDLRSLVLLSGVGLPTQAVGIAASSFETAFTLAYISGDDVRARQWVDHDDPTKMFVPIKKLVAAVVEKAIPDDAEERVDHLYRHYRQLCMGKHGNPLFVKQHSIKLDGSDVVLALGPGTDQGDVRVLQFALEHALGHSSFGLGVFVAADIELRRNTEVVSELNAIGEEWQAIHDASIKRWGQDDPFEGKW